MDTTRNESTSGGDNSTGNNGGRNGSAVEYISVENASHLLGVTKRAVRKWLRAKSYGLRGRKDSNGFWEIERESVSQVPARPIVPGRPAGSRNEPDLVRLRDTVEKLQNENRDLVHRCGYLAGQVDVLNEVKQKMLPCAESERDNARQEVLETRSALAERTSAVTMAEKKLLRGRVLMYATLAVLAVVVVAGAWFLPIALASP